MSHEVFEMDQDINSPPSPSNNQALATSNNEVYSRENSNELFPNPFLETPAVSHANAIMDADATIGTLDLQSNHQVVRPPRPIDLKQMLDADMASGALEE